MEKNAGVALYGDRIVINEGKENEMCFHFAVTSAVTVLGKNKLNIYFDGKIYQLKGSCRFNALKYVNIFHHFKNTEKGDPHGEFLGL